MRVDPEVCRQKLRGVRKSYNGTYFEMVRERTLKLEKWLKSENMRSMEDMKQMKLLEHFKNNVRPNMKFEIMRADVKIVMEAGRKADQLEAAYGVFRKDVGDRSNVVN